MGSRRPDVYRQYYNYRRTLRAAGVDETALSPDTRRTLLMVVIYRPELLDELLATINNPDDD